MLLSAATASESAPRHLHTYLARLLVARGRSGDSERALQQSTLGLSLRSPADPWVLHARLTAELHGPDAILPAVRPALDAGLASLFSLYQCVGELLAVAGRVDEAVELLREGIGRIAPKQNLFSLYQSAGELLAEAGRVDEAVGLLREGIGRVAPKQNLFSLYQSAGELLAKAGTAFDSCMQNRVSRP